HRLADPRRGRRGGGGDGPPHPGRHARTHHPEEHREQVHLSPSVVSLAPPSQSSEPHRCDRVRTKRPTATIPTRGPPPPALFVCRCVRGYPRVAVTPRTRRAPAGCPASSAAAADPSNPSCGYRRPGS